MASTIDIPAQGQADPELITLATQAKADVVAVQAGTSVAGVNGVTMPAGGALTVGTVLRATAVGTAAYGAVDLANSSAVTGTLPGANVAAAVASVSAGTISGANQAKLEGVEASADVTDFANVSAALGAASGSVGFNSQSLTGIGDITLSAAYGHTISIPTVAEGAGGTFTIQGQAGFTGDAGGDLSLKPGAGAAGQAPGFIILDALSNGAAAGTVYLVGTGVGTLLSVTGNSGGGTSCRIDMAQATATIEGTTTLNLSMSATPVIGIQAAKLGFFNTAPVVKPTVTGSRGANAALASLLTALAGLGLVTDSSS